MFGFKSQKEQKCEPDKPKCEPQQPKSEPQKPKCEPQKPKCEPQKPKREPEKPKCERDFEQAYRAIRSEWSNNTAPVDQKTRQEWTEPFLEEEELGIAILQRQHRLKQKKQAIEQQQKGNDGKPPDYDLISTTDIVPESTMTLLEKELRELREMYWKHQNRFSRYDILPPRWRLSVKEILLLRTRVDRHNHTYNWVFDRGGCCGRTCGCCERSLDQYLLPGSHSQGDDPGKNPGREKAEIHGHCTVECACCIQFRDCYIPHPRLPPTAF